MLDLSYSPLFTNFAMIIFLIVLGFYLRYTNTISKEKLQFLNGFCISVLVPCFIFTSFMRDLEPIFFSNGISIFLWGLGIHGLFIIGTKIYYTNKNIPEDQKLLFTAILPLGNITFFGIAIASILYGSDGIFTANIYSIATRIYMYTVCLIILSGVTISKKDIYKILKNPTLIVSLLGCLIYFFQDYTPQIRVNGEIASIFRIDHSLPFLYQGLNNLGLCINGLVWLIIGASFDKNTVAFALRSQAAILFAFHKNVIIPLAGILIYIIIHKTTGFTIASIFLPTTLILLNSPVSNITLLFAINYKRAPKLALACLLTSMLFSLALFPIYAILIEYLLSLKLI